MSSTVLATVDDFECLSEDFISTVKHKAKPFGLFETLFTISKQGCVLTIDQEKYKFLKNRWVVDVCRGPIHIKQGIGAFDILKREGVCPVADLSSEYCESLNKILTSIQDNGLIFAEGEKENLKSGHGQMYCSFLLVKKYLQEGIVLNKNDNSLKLVIEIDKPYIKQKQVDDAPKTLEGMEEKKNESIEPSVSF